jgi:hypothetical protein
MAFFGADDITFIDLMILATLGLAVLATLIIDWRPVVKYWRSFWETH